MRLPAQKPALGGRRQAGGNLALGAHTRQEARLTGTHHTVGTDLDTQTIRNLIEQGLPGAQVAVQGDDGVHFEALVVSEAFRGKLPLARHRLVYATLGERMGGEIHALALRTLTPEEQASTQGGAA